jgi:tetratricopeptide (TPR) repeat protein
MATTDSAAEISLTLFERHIKQALRLYEQPERLGRESPLASSYVLGHALRDLPRPVTEQMRGETLRAEIRAAANSLWRGALPTNRSEMLAAIAEARRDPDDPRYAYVVLELRCFNDYVAPYRMSDIWEQPHLLPGSKSQHYRDFDVAVRRLAALLLDRLRPALRPERPRPPEALYGYARQLTQVVESLAQGRAVALSGPGGVGKTSIGASALRQISDRDAFWYTLRPGFNDGIGSLLFALGAFLHERGAANLWRYLVTTNGVVGDLNLAAGLLREDLAVFGERPPFLCLDDIECLTSGSLDLPTPGHVQILDLIEGLRGVTPLLLIGQRGLPASDLHLELSGLSVADIARLYEDAGVGLSQEEAARLLAFSGGNPRLLTLLLTLRREGEDVTSLEGEHGVPLLLPAFQRLWRRLRPEERRALQRLSVYQGYVPEDVLEATTLDALARLRLTDHDGHGGAALLPAFAPIVYDGLSSELREQLHSEAAIVYLERGAYTAAAYHFAQARQENRAVQVWFPQRRQAIARGEADAARPIFNGISRQRLGASERKALDIIRAELHQMAGEIETGLHELEQADWSGESEATARLWMLRGQLQDALGYPDQTLTSYDEGLRVTARLLGQMATLRLRRGRLHYRHRNLKASWQELQRAEFDLAVLRGLIREEEGAYDIALESYQCAHKLAEQLDEDTLRGEAERWIAVLYGRRQQLDEAVAHAMRAVKIYERLGDRVNLEKMHDSLAYIYLAARQFQAAIEAAAPAYAFFRSIGDAHHAAVIAANLAEASFEIGDLEGATRYATEALDLGDRHAAPYAYFTLGQVALVRRDAAVASFSESMQRAQQNDDPYMVAYAQRALGRAYLAAGEEAAGQRHLLDALALFQQLDIPGEITATEELIGDLPTTHSAEQC